MSGDPQCVSLLVSRAGVGWAVASTRVDGVRSAVLVGGG